MKVDLPLKNIVTCILCLTFLLLLAPVEYAGALTFMSRTKNVRIDADWRITGQYICEVEMSQPDDIRALDQILGQFKEQADPAAHARVVVRLPDGRSIPWQPDKKNGLPAGASVRITTVISRKFPGFEGLLADALHIDQEAPIKTVTYRITFPEKTAFTCRVTRDGESWQQFIRAGCFTWSGNDITRLDITLSTAASWEEIARRYQTLFQNRMGKGLPAGALPETVRSIDERGSADERVRAVLNFLNHHLEYRISRVPGHALLPDDPATVLHRGWGDCKDFALLATAILQRMNVETIIVLTATPRSNRPEDTMPDPFIFDHTLIGLCENGTTTYYDTLLPNETVAVNNQNIYLPLKVSDHDHQ